MWAPKLRDALEELEKYLNDSTFPLYSHAPAFNNLELRCLYAGHNTARSSRTMGAGSRTKLIRAWALGRAQQSDRHFNAAIMLLLRTRISPPSCGLEERERERVREGDRPALASSSHACSRGFIGRECPNFSLQRESSAPHPVLRPQTSPLSFAFSPRRSSPHFFPPSLYSCAQSYTRERERERTSIDEGFFDSRVI